MVRMKHQTLKVFSHFIDLLYAFDKKRDHNMLALMFDLRFKNMQSISMYLGHENVVIVVIKYDEKLLLLLLMEANKLLMSNKARKAFNIHSQVVIKVYLHHNNNNNTYRDIMSRKFIGFSWFPIDVENYTLHVFSWWCKKKYKFQTIVLLVKHKHGKIC